MTVAKRVASPKGTTEAGLAVLDSDRRARRADRRSRSRRPRAAGAELAEAARRAQLDEPARCPRRAGASNRERHGRAQRTFDDRDGWIWLDGKLVPWREANVHVLTHALHYASSVFEGQRAYNGEIFKLTEHSERLRKSASLLGFELPWTVDEIDAACNEVLKANGFSRCLYAPGCLARVGADGRRARKGTKPHLAIAAWEWGKYFEPAIAAKGIRLDIAPWRRPAPYTAPVTVQGGRAST